ncbi:MAG TPA: Holliday junction resolvase RuvX [Candidatus Babeliales bacterium]|nr:Holliday junction resolvase RuvX [Candidatus Babeliales bacterium]
MKILGLDIGDVWTGVAISDALGMFARPLDTVETTKLNDFIQKILQQERIETIVIGYPKTMRGTRSEQTQKIEQMHQKLSEEFSQVSWVLWDERLSSKRAESLQKQQQKTDKKQSHAVAAAFILSSYLDFKHLHKQIE